MADNPLPRRLNRRRVDPSDIAVRTPVDDIHAAARAVLEHDAGGAGQVQFHDGFADRKPLQRRRRFRDDDRVVGGDLVIAFRRRLDDIAWRIERRRVHLRKRRGSGIGLAGRTILETALVAAQPFLDHQQRLIGTGIGVGGIGIRLERDSGIQMQRAIGAETETILAQRDVAGIIAVEIFAQDFVGALADATAQRVADIDAFSRNPKSHFAASIGLVWIGTDTIPIWPERNQAGAGSRDRSEEAGAERALPSMLCLSRRRCTEDGIRIASRYFATVRRAISIPDSRNRSTMVSSERISAGSSASINCLMWWRTASAEWASPPSADAIDAVKKYFNSKLPRLVAMYLLAVTRDTVDSCIWMASATAFKLSGRRCATPWVKKPSCCRTISVATLRMVRARWSSARTSQVAFCRQSVK